jgi:hypothetical protein
MKRGGILMVAPALGESEFVVAFQHRFAHRGFYIIEIGLLGDRIVEMGHSILAPMENKYTCLRNYTHRVLHWIRPGLNQA